MRGKRALIAAIAALLLVAAGVIVYWTEFRTEVKTQSVGPNGGTVEQFGVKVTVPKGTLTKPTELSISEPKVTAKERWRFNTPTVAFDISFADGSQPAKGKPLDVQIPLQGVFLPAGAQAKQALMYTPDDEGDGWHLVPGIAKKGVLHAKLAHLSPKEVSFFSPMGEWLDSINPLKPQEVKNCNRELTTSATGKVKLSGENWKRDTSSVLHPCLVEENGKTMLRVSNNTSVMWAVASTGPSVNAPEGNPAESGVIKLIVQAFTPNNKVKAYLAEGDMTWTQIQKDALPITLEFRADPNTFLARAFWVGLNMSVGMFSGTSGSETVAVIKHLLTLTDVISCLTDAAQTANNIFDLNKVLDIMLSTCGEIIAKSMGVDVSSKKAEDYVIGGVLAAIGGIKDSFGLLGTAYQGVMQQVNGNVTVKVTQAAPPCATTWSFKEALGRNMGVTRATKIKCSNGWAYGIVDTASGNGDGQYLIQYFEGRWTRVITLFEPLFYSDPEANEVCQRLPSDFRKELCM